MNTWVVTVPSSCWSFLGNKLQKRRLKISSSTQRLFLENREFSWDDTRGAKPLHSLVPRNRAPVDTSYGRMHCLFPDLGMNTGCVAGDLDLSELDLFPGLTETCSVVFLMDSRLDTVCNPALERELLFVLILWRTLATISCMFLCFLADAKSAVAQKIPVIEFKPQQHSFHQNTPWGDFVALRLNM